jgi:hypothetical protein
MSDEADDETAADSQQESEQQPTDGDQSGAQSEEQPADQTDQSTEQSEEQSAASDQSTDQAGDQPADSDQPDEQSAGSDQAPAQSEEQPADGDQPPTSETADNTQGSTGGAASPAGGTLGGPGKPKVQVIAKFMTNTANDPFKQGAITMNVFDGEKGTLLWKLGSMDQQKVTFQDAVLTSNVIKSAMFSGVTGNSVKVELRVKMLQADHETNPQIPEVNFGTAARFELPAKGPLNVDLDVEVTEKEFTVEAKDESSAGDAARPMLANIEEIHLSSVKSATNVGAGKFRVVFRIPTKRILILHPPTLELIY